MNDNCLICKRIESSKKRTNPFFVKELNSGYVVIGDHQSYKGYTLLLSKVHVEELHKLDKTFRAQFMEDLALVGEAVFNAFGADKLNYELLGNTEKTHVHWHIFPRKTTDPGPRGAVWLRGKEVVCSEESKPSEDELKELTQKLTKELNKVLEIYNYS
jgi:diadenosine tetraphosphate (Ap4A) HIT family hydrolase